MIETNNISNKSYSAFSLRYTFSYAPDKDERNDKYRDLTLKLEPV